MTKEHIGMTWKGVRVENMTRGELIEALYESGRYVGTLHEDIRQTLAIWEACDEARR